MNQPPTRQGMLRAMAPRMAKACHRSGNVPGWSRPSSAWMPCPPPFAASVMCKY
jgi:hypothetical protein